MSKARLRQDICCHSLMSSPYKSQEYSLDIYKIQDICFEIIMNARYKVIASMYYLTNLIVSSESISCRYLWHVLRSRRRRCHVYYGSPGHFEIVLPLVRYCCYLQRSANKRFQSKQIESLRRDYLFCFRIWIFLKLFVIIDVASRE